MVNATRLWWGYNLQSVPYPKLLKLLGADTTKPTRLILCSALHLSTADSVMPLFSLPLFPGIGRPYLLGAWPVLLLFLSTKRWSRAELTGRQETERRVGEGGVAPRKGVASV